MTLPQGRNDGGQGVHNSPGVQLRWGREITVVGAEKAQQCQKYFLQYTTFAPVRPQVRTWRRQACFLPRAPSNLVTCLRSHKGSACQPGVSYTPGCTRIF